MQRYYVDRFQPNQQTPLTHPTSHYPTYSNCPAQLSTSPLADQPT